MSRADSQMIVNLIGYLVFAAQFLAAFLIIIFIAGKIAPKNKLVKQITSYISPNGLVFAFFIALFAMSGSLFFSEVAHLVPCKLCWYQRICMYPQVLLLGIAAFKNDFGIKKYVLPLSVIGLIIAIYHYALQMLPIPLPCTDEVAKCSLKGTAVFGYITIPMMSLTAFVLIIMFMLFLRKEKVKS